VFVWRRRCSAAQSRQDANGPLRDVDLAKGGNLLPELPLPLLCPGREKPAAIAHDASLFESIGGLLDDVTQARPPDVDEGVPEVDRDRGNREARTHDQRATLDGQMSRNGQ
jgi:hypothetical protein